MYLLKKVLMIAVPTLLFAGAGFLYYRFVGCDGTCAIASSPYLSILIGGVFGALFGSVLTDRGGKNADL